MLLTDLSTLLSTYYILLHLLLHKYPVWYFLHFKTCSLVTNIWARVQTQVSLTLKHLLTPQIMQCSFFAFFLLSLNLNLFSGSLKPFWRAMGITWFLFTREKKKASRRKTHLKGETGCWGIIQMQQTRVRGGLILGAFCSPSPPPLPLPRSCPSSWKSGLGQWGIGRWEKQCRTRRKRFQESRDLGNTAQHCPGAHPQCP